MKAILRKDASLPAIGEVQDSSRGSHVQKGCEEIHEDRSLLDVGFRLAEDLA
jgi:hypothetical protein